LLQILFGNPTLFLTSVTDLRIGQIGDGLGPRLFGGPAQLFLMTADYITLKIAKQRRGITSQFTLKRAKKQTSRLLSVQLQ